ISHGVEKRIDRRLVLYRRRLPDHFCDCVWHYSVPYRGTGDPYRLLMYYSLRRVRLQLRCLGGSELLIAGLRSRRAEARLDLLLALTPHEWPLYHGANAATNGRTPTEL